MMWEIPQNDEIIEQNDSISDNDKKTHFQNIIGPNTQAET